MDLSPTSFRSFVFFPGYLSFYPQYLEFAFASTNSHSALCQYSEFSSVRADYQGDTFCRISDLLDRQLDHLLAIGIVHTD